MAFPTPTAAVALLSTHKAQRSKTWTQSLLPVPPMLPMAQTIDDIHNYYDRDFDYKPSESQQVSTQLPNILQRKAETHARFDHPDIDRNARHDYTHQ